MPTTSQHLKTDTTLEELRAAAPRDELELALSAGFVWWMASIAVLLIGSYALPPVMEHGLDYWRLGGVIFNVGMAVSHVTWMKRLPPALAFRAIFGATLLAGFANLLMTLAAPAAIVALTINLLPGVMYAAYFLSGRKTVVVTALVTLYTLVPVIINSNAAVEQRMTSRLTVWMPIVWLIALAIHMQNHERHKAVSAAVRQASTDPLTGIDNLRALRQRAAEVLDLGHDAGRVTALLLIDLDALKEINVRHGHATGDLVLQSVANSLARSASRSHEVVRIGGDMFAVLIEDVAVGDIAAMTLRYRGAATSAAARGDVPGLHLEVSVGVAVSPRDGTTFEQLMTAADRSLYAEKRDRGGVREPVASGNSPIQSRLSPQSPPKSTAVPTADSIPESEQPVFLGRPLHAVSATIGWYLAIMLVLLSTAMPDADRSRFGVMLPVVLCMFIPATLNFFFIPAIGSTRHLVNDMITLGVIAWVAYLTGGAESPAWPLVFMFLIHDGWFMSARQLAPRVLAIVLVILAPLVYADIGIGAHRTATVTTLYMGVYVAFAQTLAMGLNRTYMIRAQSIARRLAALDPLTGLPNRRSFERALNTRLEQLHYHDVDALAIVMLDLDGLQHINAEHGHGTGDILLCAIADALRSMTRAADLVARIGSDEFVALMPTSDEHQVRALAKRLVRTVDDCVARSPNAAAAKVTACAGFSLYPTHGRTFDELVSAAELAVLTVKAGGRPSRVSNIVVGL